MHEEGLLTAGRTVAVAFVNSQNVPKYPPRVDYTGLTEVAIVATRKDAIVVRTRSTITTAPVTLH